MFIRGKRCNGENERDSDYNRIFHGCYSSNICSSDLPILYDRRKTYLRINYNNRKLISPVK